jgi:hypothetical protein
MQFEVLALVVDLLDEVGIPHMLAGSFASTFHGEPRMTRDIDLVIDPTGESLRDFVDHIDRGRFYVGDALTAFQGRDMLNLVDTASGWKVDLIVRKDRPFSVEEFARRIPVTIGGVDTFVATAEDTVLTKLEWCKASGSERQFADAVAVATVQDLDRAYLARWGSALAVEDLVERLLEVSSTEGSDA